MHKFQGRIVHKRWRAAALVVKPPLINFSILTYLLHGAKSIWRS
jgi:hypothetical protein